ncbi:MAG TPA: hypothetical protein DDY49_10520 [Paenibacillaceae bacterium]|nr:hypothetical protein [Paenibacillaceae bacterium]
MIQFAEGTYRLTRETNSFRVEDADRLFFACRYEGSNEGFVIEKDVFFRQIQRGHIVKEDVISSLAI